MGGEMKSMRVWRGEKLRQESVARGCDVVFGSGGC